MNNETPEVYQIPRRRKVIFAIIATCLGMIFLETAAWLIPIPESKSKAVGTRRFIDWLSHLSLEDKAPLPLYETDRERIWKLTSGKSFQSFNFHHPPEGEHQPIEITVNAQGIRGDTAPSAESSERPFQVLCLGDSNMFGYPLDDEDVFPAVLERALSDRLKKSVRVINGGIPGYTSEQGRIWYEQQFQEMDFDWFILSYINNDAWPQPKNDHDVIEGLSKSDAAITVGRLIGNLAIVKWIRYLGRSKISEDQFVPRVGIDRYEENIQFFVEQARQKRASVLILDFCVYPEYLSYTQRLERISDKADDVHYFHVAKAALDAINQNSFQEIVDRKYLDRTQKRWGQKYLNQNPMLWLYAEMYPEHLNEVGTRWLSRLIVPTLLGENELTGIHKEKEKDPEDQSGPSNESDAG